MVHGLLAMFKESSVPINHPGNMSVVNEGARGQAHVSGSRFKVREREYGLIINQKTLNLNLEL
jgi:hypothetical protein